MLTTATTGRREDSHSLADPGSPLYALLRKGTTAIVRRPVTADTPAVTGLFDGLSRESIRLRFFGTGADLGRTAARRICESPDADGGSLIAEVDTGLDGAPSTPICDACDDDDRPPRAQGPRSANRRLR